MKIFIKYLSLAILFYCIYQICYTSCLFEYHTNDTLNKDWWYVPRSGFLDKDLRYSVLSLISVVLNMILLLQWNSSSWVLPIYQFGKKRLTRFYKIISCIHLLCICIILPFCIDYLFSISDYSSFDAEICMYGYHSDNFGKSMVVIFFLLNTFLIVKNEIRYLVFRQIN